MHIHMIAAAMLGLALPMPMLTATLNAADAGYDRRLAQAAAEIVAARMGPLRGSFSVDEKPILFVPPPSEAIRPPVRAELDPPAPGEWRNGLAIAVEKKSVVSPEL